MSKKIKLEGLNIGDVIYYIDERKFFDYNGDKIIVKEGGLKIVEHTIEFTIRDKNGEFIGEWLGEMEFLTTLYGNYFKSYEEAEKAVNAIYSKGSLTEEELKNILLNKIN